MPSALSSGVRPCPARELPARMLVSRAQGVRELGLAINAENATRTAGAAPGGLGILTDADRRDARWREDDRVAHRGVQTANSTRRAGHTVGAAAATFGLDLADEESGRARHQRRGSRVQLEGCGHPSGSIGFWLQPGPADSQVSASPVSELGGRAVHRVDGARGRGECLAQSAEVSNGHR